MNPSNAAHVVNSANTHVAPEQNRNNELIIKLGRGLDPMIGKDSKITDMVGLIRDTVFKPPLANDRKSFLSFGKTELNRGQIYALFVAAKKMNIEITNCNDLLDFAMIVNGKNQFSNSKKTKEIFSEINDSQTTDIDGYNLESLREAGDSDVVGYAIKLHCHGILDVKTPHQTILVANGAKANLRAENSKAYVINGEGHAFSSKTEVFAVGGVMSRAYAKHSDSKAYAATLGAKSYSCTNNAEAYATESGSESYAQANESRAYATAHGSCSYADKNNTEAYATKAGAKSFATFTGAIAYATISGAEAYATASHAFAYAEHPGSKAYADASRAVATANAENSESYSRSSGATAFAVHSGAKASAIINGALSAANVAGATAIAYSDHGTTSYIKQP